MKILFVSNGSVSDEKIREQLRPLCFRPDDLIIKYSFADARAFSGQEVVAKSKHLDFIMTDWNVGGLTAQQYFLNWIRESSGIYSSGNFQFNSMPIILIEDPANTSKTINAGFNGIVKGFPSDALRLEHGLKTAVIKWRSALADDLELIGLDPHTQQSYANDRTSFISYYRLKILSRQFVDGHAKNLNYLWMNPDVNQFDQGTEELYSKMTASYKVSEKQIHKTFTSHSTILQGENFCRHVYEGRFNKQRGWDIPDFVNIPHVYSLDSPEVFEVKLKTQKLISYTTTLSAKTQKSFRQVQRYADYMTSTSPLHKQNIVKYMGQLHPQYSYTLLVGSTDEKEATLDLIERLKADFDFGNVQIMRYEELLERHVHLCNRLRGFSI